MKQLIFLLALVFSVQLAVAQAPTRRCHVCQSFKKATEFSGESYTCKACVQKAADEKKRKEQQAAERRRQQQLEQERQQREQSERERRTREEAERSYQLGEDYFHGHNGKKQNHSEAVKHYQKAANMGNVDAMVRLIDCYEEGYGVEKNEAMGVLYEKKAAALGNAKAQRYLGNTYTNGYGGETQDYGEAAKWYRKAAEQGDPSAQNSLGLMYYDGEGVTKDYAEAEKWFHKAAEQGHPKAQYNLGMSYFVNGSGIPEKQKRGFQWIQKAADLGSEGAKKFIEKYGYLVEICVFADNEPVIGASVFLVDSDGKSIRQYEFQSAISNMDGKCSLVLKKGDRIAVACVGYKTLYMTIGDDAKNSPINCYLQ